MTKVNRLRLACQTATLPLAPGRLSARRPLASYNALRASPRWVSHPQCILRAVSTTPARGTSRFDDVKPGEEEEEAEGHLSPFKKQRLDDLRRTLEEEESLMTEAYPRLETPSQSSPARKSTTEFLHDFHERLAEEEVNVMGRVRSKRTAGSALMFLDVVNEFQKLQVMLSRKSVSPESKGSRNKFALFRNLIQVGDHISVVGVPMQTDAGEPTLKATRLPELLSPAMEQIPEKLTDVQTKMQERHLDMLVNQEVTDVLRMRSEITRFMREHLHSKRFLEFQTPILAENAGGAVARPFVTRATEFRNKDLAMRIAPELWLKRLVVGGVDKVFEIGPCFRNEGVDATHNPEFTMCEFYSAYTNLADLIKETEELIGGLAERSSELIKTQLTSLPEINLYKFQRPFRQIEFVPGLEAALGFRLPKLSSEDAHPELLAILKLAGVSLPGEVPTSLPKLLDRLAAMYLEPQSFDHPVFITHHPSCMSPLSKSFICPKTYQLVSARAELFVGGRELANMYEEENDPEEQKRKLSSHRNLVNHEDGGVAIEEEEDPEHPEERQPGFEVDNDGEVSPLDQSFVKTLDYGLPPTGGWGCGVERLVMLFSGAKRISDCLSFGSLRNVVGLSAEEARRSKSLERDGNRVDESSSARSRDE